MNLLNDKDYAFSFAPLTGKPVASTNTNTAHALCRNHYAFPFCYCSLIFTLYTAKIKYTVSVYKCTFYLIKAQHSGLAGKIHASKILKITNSQLSLAIKMRMEGSLMLHSLQIEYQP